MSELTWEEVRDIRLRSGNWIAHRYGEAGGGGMVTGPRDEGPDDDPGTEAASGPVTQPNGPLTAAKAACFVEKVVY
jgi:hypothetical protein